MTTTQTRAGRGPLVACCLGSFLLLFYGTATTVSSTAISRDLGGGYATAQWIIDAYTLALAALLLAAGSLGDLAGHRRMFLAGLGVFAIGSLGCGLATTGGVLVFARAAQGVGGAGLLASAVPLLAATYTGRARGRAFAAWSTIAAAGSTVGTIAGGIVAQYVSWRLLFLAAVPLCVAAAAVAVPSLPRGPARPARLDAAGTLVSTIAVAAVTYGAIGAGEHGWISTPSLVTALVAVAAVATFVRIERRSRQPILPAALFATRSFTAVLACGFAYYLATFAALPVISSWLQSAQGMSGVQAALVLSVQLVAFMIVALGLSARLHGARAARVLAGGTVLTGVSAVVGLVLLAARPEWTSLLLALVLSGIGAGAVSPVLPALAATSVPDDHAGTASAAATAARQVGLTIGVAICGALARPIGGSGTDTAHGVVAALAVCGVVGIVLGAAAATALRGR